MITPQWLPVLLVGHTQRFLVLSTQHSGYATSPKD